MAKARTIHVCQSCGWESPRWMGKCGGCGEWNSLVEEIREPQKASAEATTGYGQSAQLAPRRLGDVAHMEQARISSSIRELDRVLGGGFVPGGVVMVGGDPGIGKSTLSLQVAAYFSSSGRSVLYISGEESIQQIRMRALRLGVSADDVVVAGETSVERIEKLIRDRKPDLVIVDSIQTTATDRLTSAPGSVAQLREVTSTLTQLAKGLGIPTILIGHVTKDGAIAGPKVLEHMVDTVLYFESQAGMPYRLLRAVKNRFGSTNEIGVFEMRSDGLIEVSNPSAAFLEGRPQGASGSVVVPILEGTRPLLVEIQALISPPAWGPPRVTAIGVDNNRVILLLHILEKRTGQKVGGMDVFVNVTGGARVLEPAADLGIAMAILSSYVDRPVPQTTVVLGEVGLTGEIRAVNQAAIRVVEATKLGFDRAVVSAGDKDDILEREEIASHSITGCRILPDAARALFGDDVLTGARSESGRHEFRADKGKP